MVKAERSRRWTGAGVVAIAVSAAIAVVAMAARAPLARSTPVNAVSARAPVTALFVLLAGCGILALAGLVFVIRPRGKRDDEPQLMLEPPQTHWAWKVLGVLLPIALGGALVAAAVLGTRAVHTAPRLGGASAFGHPPALPRPHESAGGGFVLPGWIPWTCVAVAILALVAVAVLLVRRRAGRAEEGSARQAARAAVSAAIDAIEESADPRAAVIAAYVAMERTLAARGVRRSRAEAPREYLRRVLAATSCAERDARTLTGLFEEARFSSHPIPERLRELAVSALRSLRAALQARDAP
jgi:hypothetical protein